MAKSAADKQSRLANNSSEAACVLAVTQVRYLKTVRKLLVEYQSTGSVKQKQIFVKMIHAFMQELCSYPLTIYRVTKAVYSNTEADIYPHVVGRPKLRVCPRYPTWFCRVSLGYETSIKTIDYVSFPVSEYGPESIVGRAQHDVMRKNIRLI